MVVGKGPAKSMPHRNSKPCKFKGCNSFPEILPYPRTWNACFDQFGDGKVHTFPPVVSSQPIQDPVDTKTSHVTVSLFNMSPLSCG